MKYDGTNITISLKKDVNKFKGMLCEIQLTTVLSHAMNEFGHNILYKDVDELQSKDVKEYERIKNILYIFNKISQILQELYRHI